MEKQEQKEGLGVTPAKVIEGWCVMRKEWCGSSVIQAADFSMLPNGRGCVRATLVIGEKAWPESKVKDMMNELIDSGESITDNPWKMLRIAKVYDIAKRHGLTL